MVTSFFDNRTAGSIFLFVALDKKSTNDIKQNFKYGTWISPEWGLKNKFVEESQFFTQLGKNGTLCEYEVNWAKVYQYLIKIVNQESKLAKNVYKQVEQTIAPSPYESPNRHIKIPLGEELQNTLRGMKIKYKPLKLPPNRVKELTIEDFQSLEYEMLTGIVGHAEAFSPKNYILSNDDLVIFREVMAAYLTEVNAVKKRLSDFSINDLIKGFMMGLNQENFKLSSKKGRRADKLRFLVNLYELSNLFISCSYINANYLSDKQFHAINTVKKLDKKRRSTKKIKQDIYAINPLLHWTSVRAFDYYLNKNNVTSLASLATIQEITKENLKIAGFPSKRGGDNKIIVVKD